MKYHIESHPNGSWNLLCPQGKILVKEKSFTIVSQIAHCLNGGKGVTG